MVDRSFVASTARELECMKALVARLSDKQLAAMVNECIHRMRVVS